MIGPRRPATTSIVYAMTGASGLHGGIATANLNILHALVDLAAVSHRGLSVMSLLERDSDRPEFLPPWVKFISGGGRKREFVTRLLALTRSRSLLCFDHVTLALPALPLARAGLVRTVIFAHGSESWKRIKRTSCWTLKSATLCLTNSHFTLRKVQERLGHLNAVACPLGLSPEIPLNGGVPAPFEGLLELEAADGSKRSIGEKMMLMVARMDPSEREKGHRALLNVMPAVLKQHPDAQLVFAGPGKDIRALRSAALTANVGASVFFPGFAPVESLRQLYHRCYAFVMPSRQEGFGLAYLEAMNYARPCIGCRDQGAEDVIVDGETGLLVRDPDDLAELQGAISKLLCDPGLAAAMGRSGFARLHSQFTAAHYQARVKENIGRLL